MSRLSSKTVPAAKASERVRAEPAKFRNDVGAISTTPDSEAKRSSARCTGVPVRPTKQQTAVMLAFGLAGAIEAGNREIVLRLALTIAATQLGLGIGSQETLPGIFRRVGLALQREAKKVVKKERRKVVARPRGRPRRDCWAELRLALIVSRVQREEGVSVRRACQVVAEREVNRFYPGMNSYGRRKLAQVWAEQARNIVRSVDDEAKSAPPLSSLFSG